MHVVWRVLKWAGIVLLIVLALVLAIALWPASTSGLASSPRPNTSYERVLRELETTRARGAQPRCHRSPV